MSTHRDRVVFVLFFISGFCGLLYQVVWVRMAFAFFGIVTPVLSVVISVFMLGLSVGSWAGGQLIAPLTKRMKISAILFYAFAELMIGIGAFVVPRLFSLGEAVLLNTGESNSFVYLLLSAIAIALSIFPWCVFMGATFPLMMAFIQEVDRSNTKSFSFLYLANVIGAMLGTLTTALVLVELFGFHNTLWIAGFSNFLIAAVSLVLGLQGPNPGLFQEPIRDLEATTPSQQGNSLVTSILFATGFTSLAMEVVWTRAFTPVLGTQVYAFAVLLFLYLFATWVGSYLYRRDLTRGRVLSTAQLIAFLSVFALLPVVVNDPRINPPAVVGIGEFEMSTRLFPLLASLFPFCTMLGYLTPHLIDECSGGHPRGAGAAYALNILGCILGPLFASYVLLPLAGAKFSMLVLAMPFVVFCWIYSKSLRAKSRWTARLASSLLLVTSVWINNSYEIPDDNPENYVVRRDHTATIVSTGSGTHKRLWVNGIAITILSPITKFMAHLPLAFHQGRPESALVICFGMGTTYRSLLSWDIQTTAVELVPSVKEAFGYYFDDAEALLKHPKGRVVIDDGRRFLKRTNQYFDVITVDPPPPAEAAGSSLLYSEEFYELVKGRLKPDGIVQQWFAFGEAGTLQAVARSITSAFPNVKVYRSVWGWGYHFLASLSPIEAPSLEQFILALPERAQNDLVEWSADKDLKSSIDLVLSNEIPINRLLSPDPRFRVTDDKPFNEYFLLRRITGSAADHGLRRIVLR